MPVPIICLDEEVRHFAERFRQVFSKPQYQHFVTVLLGLMLCEGARTLSGLLEQIADSPCLAEVSRFLSQAPWEEAAVAESWLRHFREEMEPKVAAQREHERQMQPKRRGRPKAPVVTGYLIGDDSTMHKRKAQKMEGLGRHHSTTEEKRVPGHSMVEYLYVLLGRRCPLAPQMYRQQAVCKAEGVPFQSKIELMETTIRTFEPVAGTLTHVLLDSWYSAKCLWRAARQREFLITTGLKSNRWLAVADPSAPKGWKWQRLSDYTAQLKASDYVQLKWPKGKKTVYVHVVTTRVRSLYRSQVVIVRQSLEAPVSQARYWASSNVEASPEKLLSHIAARWDIEVLFGDGKEELGWDQYQLMSARPSCAFGPWRCWPMSCWKKNATEGLGSGNAMSPLGRPDGRSSAVIVGICSIGFMDSSNLALNLTPSTTSSRPKRGLPKSAKIEKPIALFELSFTGPELCKSWAIERDIVVLHQVN